MSKRMFKLDTVLTFGKHKGNTIKEIYCDDPGYIDWMLDNFTDDFHIDIIEMVEGDNIPAKLAWLRNE